jgi:ribose 5-phosphate isomerase RpiB
VKLMIVTVRQLEDLHKAGGVNGEVRLPVGARLTPLAQDWLRSRRLGVQYADSSALPPAPGPAPACPEPAAAAPAIDQVLWWCDGPCGQAKAAITALAREINLHPMVVRAEPKQLVQAIRMLATQIGGGQASAGVLVVQAGASATVLANRCSSLRAILGTCRQSVEQGLNDVAANVLIIEHPYQTLMQVRNMLSLFLSRRSGLSEAVAAQIRELSTCG